MLPKLTAFAAERWALVISPTGTPEIAAAVSSWRSRLSLNTAVNAGSPDIQAAARNSIWLQSPPTSTFPGAATIVRRKPGALLAGSCCGFGCDDVNRPDFAPAIRYWQCRRPV